MAAPGSTGMDQEQAFFRDVQSQAFWERLAPGLHIGRVAADGAVFRSGLVAVGEPVQAAWLTDGYVELPRILDPPTASGLARAVLALRAGAIHPTFVYVYDDTWQILDAVRPAAAALLGADCEVVADAWAFCVDPRSDRGGWPIHRGWYEDVRDVSGNPGLLNVWVSLTDADERNACMHLVPLARDPHYPNDLRDLSGLEGAGVARPTAAGTALVWNANAAHWGGSCDPSFGRPRVSVTFTLRRAGSTWTDLAPVRPPLSFSDRLDFIARQLVTYGAAELDAGSAEMRWAAMVDGMRSAAVRIRPGAV
jgi:hypothetical protein